MSTTATVSPAQRFERAMVNTCAGCAQPTANRKFCSLRCWSSHANAKRHGRPLAERFWPRVDRRGPDECWPWFGARDAGWYGVLGLGSRRDDSRHLERAHRVAWSLANNDGAPIPDGLHIRHRCDNPPCCNPGHLLTGTPAQNVQDKVERGRAPNGEQHSGAKLTAQLVRQLRAECRQRGALAAFARAHGIPYITAYDAFRGTTLRHI